MQMHRDKHIFFLLRRKTVCIKCSVSRALDLVQTQGIYKPTAIYSIMQVDWFFKTQFTGPTKLLLILLWKCCGFSQ